MLNLSDMSRADLEAFAARMAMASKGRALSLKVSKAGAVSLYGMGRFPVTLYSSQWEKVLDMSEAIRAFMEDNRALLSSGKDDTRFAKTEG